MFLEGPYKQMGISLDKYIKKDKSFIENISEMSNKSTIHDLCC